MDLVDYVKFVAGLAGSEMDLLSELSYIIHTGVGGSVDLDEIKEPPFIDGPTDLAKVARLLPLFGQAVDRLSQDAGGGGLPRPPGTAEEVGVDNPSCG